MHKAQIFEVIDTTIHFSIIILSKAIATPTCTTTKSIKLAVTLIKESVQFLFGPVVMKLRTMTVSWTEEDSKNSLIFLKLFPFVLTTFSLLGGFTKGLWELYNRRNSSQVYPISIHFRPNIRVLPVLKYQFLAIVDCWRYRRSRFGIICWPGINLSKDGKRKKYEWNLSQGTFSCARTQLDWVQSNMYGLGSRWTVQGSLTRRPKWA